MRSLEALRVLAEVTEAQWGLVTSAQANARGVSHMNLTRLTESGALIRLTHGVYRDAGAPSDTHEELRAAWLAAAPKELAYERLKQQPCSLVVSGESASKLHGIGDFRAMRSEFTSPVRKQTNRADVRYRTRVLPEQDVVLKEGLPVTTRERTIADLVEDRQDFSTVGDALRDAAQQSKLDSTRLVELMGPLAERNGYRKGAGRSLYDDLLRAAGVDLDSLARQLGAVHGIGERIAAQFVDTKVFQNAVKSILQQSSKDGFAEIIRRSSGQGFASVAPNSKGFADIVASSLPTHSELVAKLIPAETSDAIARATAGLSSIDLLQIARSVEDERGEQ